MNDVTNINEFGAAKRPNIKKNQGCEGVRGRGVYFGELLGNYLCFMALSFPKHSPEDFSQKNFLQLQLQDSTVSNLKLNVFEKNGRVTTLSTK